MPDAMIPMKGAQMQYTISATKTRVPGVTSIDDIQSVENPMLDNTPLDGTNVTNVSGTPDYGELSFKGNWNPVNTVHQALDTRAKAGTEGTFTLILANSDASEVEVVGPFKSWKITGGDKGGRATFSAVVKINSITITP